MVLVALGLMMVLSLSTWAAQKAPKQSANGARPSVGDVLERIPGTTHLSVPETRQGSDNRAELFSDLVKAGWTTPPISSKGLSLLENGSPIAQPESSGPRCPWPRET